ncbi:MAG: hypothetical protein V3U75_01940 [Methylococcaceae bacterium]
MATCPKCHSADCTKDGIVKEKQRYKCKSCGYRHTVSHQGLRPDIKRQALELHILTHHEHPLLSIVNAYNYPL